MLWEKDNQKEMITARGQQLFQTQKYKWSTKKDNYFSKYKIRKWETTFQFNKKLPVEDVTFDSRDIK